jgi:glyoxylase-like metal-dependent hydrolase (beta-lactamase superfamily II)
LHHIKGYLNWIFLAEYEDGLFLLDGGSPADVKTIETFVVDELGRRMEDIRFTVVTHMHPDHSSAAPVFRDRYQIPIAAPRESNVWYDGFRGSCQHIVDNLLATYMANKLGRPIKYIHHPKQIPIDFILDDNEKLPWYNDWQILLLPGHTDHDIALYHKDKKLLYAADLLIKAAGRFQLPFPVTDPLAMKHSLLRVLDLDLKRLLISHIGEVDMTDIKEVLKDLSTKTHMPADRLGSMLRYLAFITPRAGTHL